MNYAQAEIELLFETVFKPLHFDEEVCKWMQNILLQEHKEKSHSHYQHVSALQGRYKMLEKYIDQAYEDKLAGSLSEAMWREKNTKWLVEQKKIKNEMEALSDEKQEYIQNGVLLIELAQRTESTYKSATPEVKRRLVEIVSSNHVLRNGTIQFEYRKPFDILAKSHPSEVWWAQQDSNLRPRDYESPALTN